MAVAGDHVLGALDDGVRQDGPDELELADARLPVASGDGGDRAVVLDDAIAVRPDRLGGRDVAVLVEDRGQLDDLGLQRPLRCQPALGVGDARVAAAGEEPVDGGGVLVVEIAEQLVGERAVRLREQRVGELGGRVRQLRTTTAAVGTRDLGGPDEAVLGE